LALLTKTGFKPTLLKALTGELTPPGIDFCALSKADILLLKFMLIVA
jgi:hypothetical protein